MELTQVKHEIETLAEKYRDEFEAVSAYIFAHPELAYHEMLVQAMRIWKRMRRRSGKYSTIPDI